MSQILVFNSDGKLAPLGSAKGPGRVIMEEVEADPRIPGAIRKNIASMRMNLINRFLGKFEVRY